MTDYCTEQEFLDYYKSNADPGNEVVQIAISAASRQIEAHCGRVFYAAGSTASRYYSPNFATEHYVLPVDDIATTTALVVATTTLNDGTYPTVLTINTDFLLEPVNQNSVGLSWPYTHIRLLSGIWPVRTIGTHRDTVKVTATFGWPAVPDPVKQATKLLTAQFVKLQDAPFGVAGWGAYGDIRVRDLPQVATLLAPYRKGNTFGIA